MGTKRFSMVLLRRSWKWAISKVSGRKEEEGSSWSPPVPPAPSHSAHEAPATPGYPANERCLEVPPALAVIGRSVVIKGEIYIREDLNVEGEVQGVLQLPEHCLIVGPSGKLQANIKACQVVIAGTVHGNIEAIEKVELRKEAKLTGDIRTTRLVVEDGAYFKGSIDIQKVVASGVVTPPEPEKSKEAAGP
jgi:cytoskeletal protein CcmA (bactofilin family)